MSNSTDQKEDKHLDPFFVDVRHALQTSRSNIKLRDLLETILGNTPATLSHDIVSIQMPLEQYEALCLFTGTKPRINHGQTTQLCPGSNPLGESDISIHEEGDESGENRPSTDQVEQEGQ